MPSTRQGARKAEFISVAGLGMSLTTTVPTVTRLVRWYSKQFSIPIQPRYREVGDFTTTEPESAAQQADEPSFEAIWFVELVTGVKKALEFAFR